MQLTSSEHLASQCRQYILNLLPIIRHAKGCQTNGDSMTVQVIMANNEGAGPGEPSAAGSNASLAASAAAATAAEIPQGGGTAVQAAAEAAGLGGNAPMVLRMRPNPGLQGPSPVFMRRSAEPKSGESGDQLGQLLQRDSMIDRQGLFMLTHMSNLTISLSFATLDDAHPRRRLHFVRNSTWGNGAGGSHLLELCISEQFQFNRTMCTDMTT